jgi:hypothetical protein
LERVEIWQQGKSNPVQHRDEIWKDGEIETQGMEMNQDDELMK